MSKYALAKAVMQGLNDQADSAGIDGSDAQEAMLILLVQSLKDAIGADSIRSLLQYEIDNLGSGGAHDLPRGGGHS